MNILIGSSSAPEPFGGGINAYAKEVSEALAQCGAQIFFVAPPPQDNQWIATTNIKLLPIPKNTDPEQAVAAILDFIKEHKIDGVINNDNPFLQAAAPGMHCPFIAVGHFQSTTIASLACFQSAWSDYVVAISYDMQKNYVQRGVPLWKCPVIHNGVIDPLPLSDLNKTRTDTLNIVFAGSHHRFKGSKHVIEAIRKGSEVWHGMLLHWFGDMPKKLFKEMSQYPHVVIHGKVNRNKYLDHLKNADVLLLPSTQEGCPMTMLEAMSYGVVPIASNGIGAMRWLIDSGKEGFICYLNNWAEQALGALALLKKDTNKLNNMSQAARDRYLNHFQMSRVATDLLILLKTPTVSRTNPPKKLTKIRWHRGQSPYGKRASLLDRFLYRLGILITHE